jgi:hypothetical protein
MSLPMKTNDCINGFLVVRKPTLCYDEKVPRAYSTHARKIGEIYYSGVDRMPWYDVEEDYYINNLPQDILNIYLAVKRANRDFTGLNLCFDIQDALRLLRYSNRNEPRDEIIAVYSESLINDKGSFISIAEIQWIGFDVFAFGEWSLLSEGMFLKPEKFPDFRSAIGPEGLFADWNSVAPYMEAYLSLSRAEIVEPLADPPLAIDGLRIGRVRNL